jgi:tRNA G10  N-methylase Trm11
MPEYLVRLAQIHESFRKAELHALAELAGVGLEIVKYDDDVGTFRRIWVFSQPLLSNVNFFLYNCQSFSRPKKKKRIQILS